MSITAISPYINQVVVMIKWRFDFCELGFRVVGLTHFGKRTALVILLIVSKFSRNAGIQKVSVKLMNIIDASEISRILWAITNMT